MQRAYIENLASSVKVLLKANIKNVNLYNDPLPSFVGMRHLGRLAKVTFNACNVDKSFINAL